MILTVTKAVMCLVLGLVLHGCATAPVHPPKLPSGTALNDLCTRYNVNWQWDGVTQVVMLDHKGNKAKALVGSPVVMVGLQRVNLSGPLRRVESIIYVPDDFESKVLAPFGVTPIVPGGKLDQSRLKVRTVVLDPGHGGKDPGAQGRSGVKEKEVVLDIAKRVKTILEDAGIKVIMSRDKDEFISLPERTEITSRSDADLFVSVHANSNPVRKTEGIEAYYVRTFHKDDLDEDQRKKNEKIFAKKLNLQYTPVIKEIIADMMYQSKIAESSSLARLIVSQGADYVGTPNRGARTCRFFVVRNTLVPAVLVEVGFLTNRHEEKKLGTLSYRQKLAETIARSIINYATDAKL